MTELGAIFSRLGLEQYLDAFVTEGFESWKTVLDITESDLYDVSRPLLCQVRWANPFSDALGVKLGHRRVSEIDHQISPRRAEGTEIGQKLQREIANSRIYFSDQHSPPPEGEGRNGRPDERAYYGNGGGKNSTGSVEKRKYQRHPKVFLTVPNVHVTCDCHGQSGLIRRHHRW